MSSDAAVNPPVEAAPEVNIESAIDTEVINKYVIPHDVFFLKEKRRVPINQLNHLVIGTDIKGKMILKAEAQAADGKWYKTSTYLGLKDRPVKKRSPRKKKSPKTDAAAVASASAAPAAPEASHSS
jgi:hypothetical protein